MMAHSAGGRSWKELERTGNRVPQSDRPGMTREAEVPGATGCYKYRNGRKCRRYRRHLGSQTSWIAEILDRRDLGVRKSRREVADIADIADIAEVAEVAEVA